MITEGSLRRRRARRRSLALAGVASCLLGSVGFWLANSGTSSPNVSPPAGTPAGGVAANVTPLTASVTRTNGGASLQVGVALARIDMSYAEVGNARVMVAWTDVKDAAQVLNNPNAQISVGLYHTIHLGACNASSNTVDAPLVNVTDSNGAIYCAALDEGVTGPQVSSTGKLLLTTTQVSGVLSASLTSSSSISACAASSSDTDTWCQPSVLTDSSERSLYVIASIVTPGGIPQGQQPDLNSLTFYVGATVH